MFQLLKLTEMEKIRDFYFRLKITAVSYSLYNPAVKAGNESFPKKISISNKTEYSQKLTFVLFSNQHWLNDFDQVLVCD